MDAILQPHYEAACARVAAHPVVLAVQDTTSLNYNTQPAIENLGPIGTRADTWMGLMVHDTMAFSPVSASATSEKSFPSSRRKATVAQERAGGELRLPGSSNTRGF
jgi:hypothetical protein